MHKAVKILKLCARYKPIHILNAFFIRFLSMILTCFLLFMDLSTFFDCFSFENFQLYLVLLSLFLYFFDKTVIGWITKSLLLFIKLLKLNFNPFLLRSSWFLLIMHLTLLEHSKRISKISTKLVDYIKIL
jgi:hypothetical protein